MTGRATPLADLHRELGAKLTEFSGWSMPLHYAGVVAEHRAVRSSAGLFDVSHLGKLRVAGPSAEGALDHALTADLPALEPGRARYALTLTERGGCIDDLFVYRLAAEDWLVVPNAANVSAVSRAIEASGGEVSDQWDRWAIVALQGPDSGEVLERAWPGFGARDMKLHRWRSLEAAGRGAFAARTGYTGERGFELYLPASDAEAHFRRLLEAGAVPVGLGARDTLRIEMGYALYGHELTRDINPLEAGLEWAIAWDTDFRGRDALQEVRASGPRRSLFGLVCIDRGVPRHGHAVYRGDDAIGRVTSGNHSPSLGTGIALALGDRASAPEPSERVFIEARGRRIAADIVEPPFFRRARNGV